MLRATLKGLLSRKLRLVLSGLAVVLGVMATSGALILSSTLTSGFDQLFADVNTNVDVAVSGKTNVASGEEAGDAISQPVPASAVEQVAAVPGVAKAYGEVVSDGARVVGPDGKVIVNQGPPTLGSSWRPDNSLVELRSGHGPRAPDEVAINATLAKRGEFEVGDKIQVLTLQPQQTFTLVGIFGYAGGRDTIGGSTEVAFTEQTAQRLMLGETGVYSRIVVEARDGVDHADLRDDGRAAVLGVAGASAAPRAAASCASGSWTRPASASRGRSPTSGPAPARGRAPCGRRATSGSTSTRRWSPQPGKASACTCRGWTTDLSGDIPRGTLQGLPRKPPARCAGRRPKPSLRADRPS